MTSNGKEQITIQEVRSAFVANGTSLHRWAREKGLSPQHIHMALRGQRNGPVAKKLIEQVLSGVRGGA